jgi:hypothetical protein
MMSEWCAWVRPRRIGLQKRTWAPPTVLNKRASAWATAGPPRMGGRGRGAEETERGGGGDFFALHVIASPPAPVLSCFLSLMWMAASAAAAEDRSTMKARNLRPGGAAAVCGPAGRGWSAIIFKGMQGLETHGSGEPPTIAYKGAQEKLEISSYNPQRAGRLPERAAGVRSGGRAGGAGVHA